MPRTASNRERIIRRDRLRSKTHYCRCGRRIAILLVQKKSRRRIVSGLPDHDLCWRCEQSQNDSMRDHKPHWSCHWQLTCARAESEEAPNLDAQNADEAKPGPDKTDEKAAA